MIKNFFNGNAVVNVLLVVLGFLSLVLLSGCLKQTSGSENKFLTVRLANQEINAELALTEQEKYRGLSGRDSLQDGSGMLFLFDDYQPRTFVMRKMKFAIDIIWLNDGRVVGITNSVQPDDSNPEKPYYSPGPVNAVLELPAGWSLQNNLKIGDVAFWKK